MKCLSDSLCIARADIKVIFKNPDRPNIYQQLRVLPEALDVGLVSSVFDIESNNLISRNLDTALGFLLPIIADGKFSKCQIFSISKHLNDVVGVYDEN